MGNLLTKFTFKISVTPLGYDNLSVRHHKLNTAVNDAFNNKLTIDEVDLSDDQTDVDNIYRIDLASKYRNVDYIMENLKSTDSFCVTRALKAHWLFTDDKYSHIINPTYISITLQPLMSDKAFNKFMNRLARHVNDEKRCEEFYMHFVQVENDCYMKKFLLKCSICFIKSRIVTDDFDITPEYLSLLSLKSQEILVAYIESERNMSDDHIYALKHLIFTHGEFYLDLLEKYISENSYLCNRFGQRVTREILRNHKERIFIRPYTYVRLLHFKQLAHALTHDEVKDLSFQIGKYEDVWRNDLLKSLISLLPSEEQYEFIKSVFGKLLPDQNFEMDNSFIKYNWYVYMSDMQREEWALKRIAQRNEYLGKFYKWYKFVGFSKTFIEMKKLLRAEPDASERESMFEILISTCDNDGCNITKLLKYFHDRHINETILLKQHIIQSIMEKTCIYKCGNEVWSVLNEILLSMRIYENENNCSSSFKQSAIAHVIAHHIIYDKPITDKMFKLYEKYYTMLVMMITTPWKDKVFDSLYKWLVVRINEQDLKDSICRNVAVNYTEKLVTLINDFKQPVNAEVAALIRKIREHDVNVLLDVTCDEMFKEFFPEEQPLPDENICLQKLKKNVASLDFYKAQFDAEIKSNAMKYRRFLSKIRIYFAGDLALEWRKYYLSKLKENLEDSTGCACVLFGLSVLLPAPEYEELIRQYQPENAKLIWSETDPCLVNIQTNIAKFIHLIRPTVHPEFLTSFAKGDFLQYATNSLMSVSRQLPQEQCREMIVKLLASPVSVQKHGIRMAFNKFTTEELIDIFGKVWAKSENVSIRQLLFISIHNMLVTTKDETECLAIWKLLNTIMTQLHGNEFLTNIVNLSRRGLEDVSLSVRPQYCTAYWHLLQTAQNCEEIWRYRTVIIEVMIDDDMVNLLDERLLRSIICNFLQSLFYEELSNLCDYSYITAILCLMAKYLILCKSEEVAERRKNDILTIATQEALSNWNASFNDHTTKKMFRHFLRIVITFSKDVLYKDEEAFYNPIHVLEYIQKQFDSKLSEFEYYEYRLWLKFAIILVSSLSESRALEPGVRPDDNHLWSEIFGKHTIDLMRNETAANYPRLPQVFNRYLKKFVYHECYSYERDRFYIGLSKVLMEEKEDIHCLYLSVKYLSNVSRYSSLRAEADVVLNALKELNIPDLNYYILRENCNPSPFGY